MNVLPARSAIGIPLFILAGVSLGMISLAFLSSSTRWVVSFSLAMTAMFVSMSLRRPEALFLSLFCLSLPINATNYLGRVSQDHVGGPAGYLHTLYDFPLLFLYLLWIPRMVLSRTWRVTFSGVDLCFLGFFVMSVLSMWNAVDINLCLFALVRLVVVYLIYFYAANAVDPRKDLHLIIISLILGLSVESLLGFLQYLHAAPIGLEYIGEAEHVVFQGISRVGGTLNHPNSFANYLGLVLPLPLSLLITPIRLRYKLISGCVFLAGVCALILSLSRGGWISFLFAMVVFLIMASRVRVLSKRQAALFAAVLICLFAGLIVFFQDVIVTRLFSDDEGSAASRIPMMQDAWTMIKRHPLLGVGFNNYHEARQLILKTTDESTVHNAYLLIAAEVGLVGLAFIVSAMLMVFLGGYKRAKSLQKYEASIVVALLSGLAHFASQVFIEPTWISKSVFVLFWFLAGIIIIVSREATAVTK